LLQAEAEAVLPLILAAVTTLCPELAAAALVKSAKNHPMPYLLAKQ
jgi:hypothetical protein